MGTDCVDVVRCRSCGDGDAETPGGSSASLVPEYIVSMVAAAGGLLRDPIECWLFVCACSEVSAQGRCVRESVGWLMQMR